MPEWLLSGHNPQEWTGVARPMTVSAIKNAIDDQTSWFLLQLAGGSEGLDMTMPSMVPIQGRLYLNIGYLVRNVGAVLPFDPASVGVPADQVPPDLQPPPSPLGRKLALPLRIYRIYRQAAHYDRHELPALYRELQEIYWQMREHPDEVLPLIWRVFDPEFHGRLVETTRAHAIITLVITSLDSILRQRAPQLLALFTGQATATSQIGQRIWELRQTAEQCGPEVRSLLEQGIADLSTLAALPDAAPLTNGVRAFLREYGHRGFRFERDYETERLADRPEHVLLAIAGQLGETEPPEARAEAAQRLARRALWQMNPFAHLFWRGILRWARRLISWREDSNTSLALSQATYGLAARLLARRFYPNDPDDIMFFYTENEFLAFTRSRGEQWVERGVLDRRRADFDLYSAQPPPPELIWYDPLTQLWRPVVEEEQAVCAPPATRLQGIAASAGSGPVEGIALVTNDPLEAGRRLLEISDPVVLVTRLTDPAWASLFGRLSAVVTELGGVISHAAIVARENGLPAIVGVPEATKLLRHGQRLRVDGQTGIIEVVG